MFSWICPQCGHDVPPSKTDCPFCAERAKEAAAVAAATPVAADPHPGPWPPHPPQYASQQTAPYMPPAPAQPTAHQTYEPPPPAPSPQQPHQWQAPPPQQNYQAPPQYAPPQYQQQHPSQTSASWPPPSPQRRPSPPMWLMAGGFALAFLLVGAGAYYFMQRPAATNPAEKAGIENPSDASKQKVSNPLQKYVEVVGLRIMEQNKKPVVRFVVVNHSSAEISDLKANVTLWASTSRSEEDSIGSFSFNAPSVEANDSKELTAPLKTKLKTYELPDWQNATAEIQITSPAP